MQLYVRAYLYGPSTVVMKKSQIVNAKDDEFTEVRLYIPMESIKEMNEEIDLLGLDENEDEY